MKRATGSWLALAFIVSCAPSRPAAETAVTPAPPPAAPSSAAAAKPTGGSEADSALQAKLSRALAYVSEVRGLSKKSDVQGRLIGRLEIEKFVRQQLEEETPPDVVAATEALLYGLGSVSASFDYRAAAIALMSSQLLGFYDPKRKTFFVGGDLSGEEADATLWHELVHALQDQHYDLSGLTDWQPDQGDRQAAVHALAEGDATSAMLDAMLKPRGGTALDLPDGLLRAESVLGTAALSAPPVLVRSLIAPYVDGLVFANFMRRKGGFAAVDEVWRAPPASTEQLLHPEKYLAREAPLSVAAPPAPPGLGLDERFRDVMGEQTLRIVLEDWLPARTAAEAASDWGGDRLVAFSDAARQRWAIGWHVRFDSKAAAERALLAFARSLPLTDLDVHPKPEGTPPRVTKVKGDQLCLLRHTQGPIAVVRRGPDLAVTLGPFERSRARAAAQVTPDPGCVGALAWALQIVTH